jgi:hypothetical protein
MTRSKKIFLGFVVVFFCSLCFLVYDISSKTTFPGSKKRAKQSQEKDSVDRGDTVKSTSPPKSSVHQP